jgi:hypothetical protein
MQDQFNDPTISQSGRHEHNKWSQPSWKTEMTIRAQKPYTSSVTHHFHIPQFGALKRAALPVWQISVPVDSVQDPSSLPFPQLWLAIILAAFLYT